MNVGELILLLAPYTSGLHVVVDADGDGYDDVSREQSHLRKTD